MLHRLAIFALGEPRVEVDGQPLPERAFESRHCLSLLVLMAEQDRRAVESEFLMRTLWPGADAQKGALHTTVSRLRKAFSAASGGLWPAVLASRRGLYRLGQPYRLAYDVAELEALEEGELDESELCARLLRLCRGSFMAGYQDEWVLRRRSHLERRLERLVAALQKRTDSPSWAGRVEVYQRLLQLSPCQETTHRALVESLVRSGHVAAARAEIGQFQRALKLELDAEPGAELRSFWSQVSDS